MNRSGGAPGSQTEFVQTTTLQRGDWSVRIECRTRLAATIDSFQFTGDLETFEAKSVPPATTRAKLRGDFIRAAQARRRDFTVDWVHLKLNDQAQRTVLCKDPFKSRDERVERLIESL